MKLSDLRKTRERDDENWQLSLADMMTLLLCFYVLIVSVSRLDPARYDKVAASLEKAMAKEPVKPAPVTVAAKAPPAPENAGAVRDKITKTVLGEAADGKPRKKTLAELKQELEAKFANIPGKVDLTARKDAVAISLRGAAFFDLASAELSPASTPVLADIAASLAGTPYKLTIEGHTDNLPIESWLFPSNWELSSARASRVARFLIEHGVDKNEVKVEGLADTRPMLPNEDENGVPIPENQARNRRVVILVSP